VKQKSGRFSKCGLSKSLLAKRLFIHFSIGVRALREEQHSIVDRLYDRRQLKKKEIVGNVDRREILSTTTEVYDA